MSVSVVKVRDWIWENTDSITKWLQILALMVAGYWAYTRFFRVEAPSLEAIVHVDFRELTVHDASNSCRLRIAVVVHNDGHSSFDVGRLEIRGWRSDVPQAAAGSPTYFNVDTMQSGVLVLNADPPPDLSLSRHYPPGFSYDQDFTWAFKALDGLYVFRVDTYDPQNKLLNTVRRWTELSCGQSK